MTALVIALVAVIAAVAAELRARRRARRARRLLRQLDSALADLRRAKFERDSARRWLATTVRIARQLRAQRDEVAAEIDQTYLASAAIVVGLCEERDRAELSEGRAVNRSIAHRKTIDALRAGSPCADLDAYFDDELRADQADAFRDHLATCERCQRVLHGRMQEAVATHMQPEAGQ